MPALRNWVAGIVGATEAWRGPVFLGVSAAVLLWAVWYFTKAPCTMAGTKAGTCNPSVLAGGINHQILAQCVLLGLAVGTVKGGYDQVMLNRERKHTEEERKRADAAEARLEEERKRVDSLFEEHRAEQRESREERRQQAATQQALMNTLAEINSTLAQLLVQQRNGRSLPEN